MQIGGYFGGEASVSAHSKRPDYGHSSCFFGCRTRAHTLDIGAKRVIESEIGLGLEVNSVEQIVVVVVPFLKLTGSVNQKYVIFAACLWLMRFCD